MFFFSIQSLPFPDFQNTSYLNSSSGNMRQLMDVPIVSGDDLLADTTAAEGEP
jgi:hypothetical protein